jgi:hypothetical protein
MEKYTEELVAGDAIWQVRSGELEWRSRSPQDPHPLLPHTGVVQGPRQ